MCLRTIFACFASLTAVSIAAAIAAFGVGSVCAISSVDEWIASHSGRAIASGEDEPKDAQDKERPKARRKAEEETGEHASRSCAKSAKRSKRESMFIFPKIRRLKEQCGKFHGPSTRRKPVGRARTVAGRRRESCGLGAEIRIDRAGCPQEIARGARMQVGTLVKTVKTIMRKART